MTLVKELNERIEKQEETINEQKKIIDTLSKGQSSPALSYSNLVSKNVKKTETEIVLLAKVRTELKEQARIERNIVISGLPESTGEDNTEIEQNEKLLVEELINELKIAPSKVKRHIRLKKRGASTENPKPNLLLIEFEDNNSQTTALSNASLLKNKYKFRTVYVNPDKTQAERAAEAKLRKTRNELNQALPNLSENGIHRYGFRENNKKFYWGIRSGRLVQLEPRQIE